MAGGEPLAARDDIAEVAARFVAAARGAGRRAAFFATDGQLADAPGFARLLLGEQPIWDPTQWDDTLASSRSLRAQLRRARNKGVEVRQLTADEVQDGSAMRLELDALVRRWQATRAMADMGFLVSVQPFGDAAERLLFVAEVQDRPVALLSMAPVYARHGWLFEDLLRDTTAPNGTSELLVDAGMRAAAAIGCQWATLGLAPLSGEVSPWLVRIRWWATPFFNFQGLRAFKAKLHPQSWEPLWLAYPAQHSPMRTLLDSLSAFAGGSMFGFGWRTLRRGPRPVLIAMTLLLVPWTAVLALLQSPRWFPSVRTHVMWVVFDVLLLIGLAALVRRWRDWLGVALAAAVTLDATLSTWQAAWWYAPRATGVIDHLLMVLACAGPFLAAVVLWGTVARNRLLRAVTRP